MIVNNLKYGYDTYNANAQHNQTPNRQHTNLPNDTSVRMDKVTISEEAKRLNVQTDEKNLPLQANALPSWFNKYIPSSSMQSTKVDHDFWNFIGGLTSDNSISSDEKIRIKEYLQRNHAYQQRSADDKFASEHNNDIKDYMSALSDYFKDSLQENGITSKQDYYNKVILNEDISEQVHQTMTKKIENDSDILELMSTLGVKTTA